MIAHATNLSRNGKASRPSARRKHYRFHPLCLLFPQLGDKELQELAEDIRLKGLLHPIVLYQGMILDGRNRYLACKIAGVKPRFVAWKGPGSPLESVISDNLIRRHLTSSQRAVVAFGLLPLLEREARERQLRGTTLAKKLAKVSSNGTGKASQVAARLTRTNSAYVEAAKSVEATAPELIEEVRNGRLSIPDARELARSTKSVRKRVLGIVCNGGPKKKVSRLIREATIAARKMSARRFAESNGAADKQGVLHGDMNILWKRLRDGSVKMFLTDPPYARPELYGDLAELAASKLCPGGLCLAYADPGRLIDVLDAMREHLSYWWTFAVSHTGKPRYVNDRRIQNKWKPIVAFGRGDVPLPPEWLGDFLEGGGRDKEHHHWGQPESEARYLITRLTEARDLVVDPFAGGGTVPAACKILGRRWLASEIDRETVIIARKRLADMGHGRTKP